MHKVLCVIDVGYTVAEADLSVAATVLGAIALAALSITCAVLVVAFERMFDAIEDQE